MLVEGHLEISAPAQSQPPTFPTPHPSLFPIFISLHLSTQNFFGFLAGSPVVELYLACLQALA